MLNFSKINLHQHKAKDDSEKFNNIVSLMIELICTLTMLKFRGPPHIFTEKHTELDAVLKVVANAIKTPNESSFTRSQFIPGQAYVVA